jgi:hypothetical protein
MFAVKVEVAAIVLSEPREMNAVKVEVTASVR